jgi:phosphonate transport system permease protein
MAPLAAHSLFRFEWNLRMATVLGVIGAGGVGQALYEAQQLFFYRQMLAWLLVTFVLVALVDRAGEALRRRYGLLQTFA